jgi:ATP-dependent Lon protease
MATEKLKIPILPVQNLVFFPRTSVPLTIENPVAIQIIKDCIEFDCPVGLALVESFGTFVSEIPRNVCGIGVPIMLEETDNQIKIVINGLNRVRVGKIIQNYPYNVYDVETFEDKEEKIDQDDLNLFRLKKVFEKWLDQSLLRQSERKQLMDSLEPPAHLIDYICMFLVRDVDIRQILLESHSLTDRIQTLSLIFRDENPFLEDFNMLQVIKEFDHLEKTAQIAH